MKLELHILQNFAPSNLNRDDTGAPKDCEFGGFRRARISSQCLKRAIRQAFTVHKLVDPSDMAARTKRLLDQVVERLSTAHKRPADESAQVTKAAIEGGGGLKIVDENKTQYLLYLPRRHVDALAALIHAHWDELVRLPAGAPQPAGADGNGDEGKEERKREDKAAGDQGKGKRKKEEKAAAKAAFPRELGRRIADILGDASKAIDLALFGRMIADRVEWNVDAACQVAHALSTNRVGMEFDFYTAVDDFRPEDTQGSDMMGTVAFNSACFYRYAVVDCEQLAQNLGVEGKSEVRGALDAFLRAAFLAIPTGKQNSMAAQNLPSYLLAIARPEGAPVSLANAFLKPARAGADQDLVDVSIARIEEYLQKMSAMYGAKGARAVTCADRALSAPSENGAVPLEILRQPSIDGLVNAMLATLPS